MVVGLFLVLVRGPTAAAIQVDHLLFQCLTEAYTDHDSQIQVSLRSASPEWT
jgi:hypothetical protein